MCNDISCHHMSSGWLYWIWYLIRMTYDHVILSSGWHTLPFLSHPDEIAIFDFSQHVMALKRFRRGQHCTAWTVLDGFSPYLAPIISCMRGCVTCNERWPRLISSRSFSPDFAIKLLKYSISCRVRFTAPTVLDIFFPYLAQMIINMRGCVVRNDIWPWHISSRSFSCEFAIKTSKTWHILSCPLHSTVLDGVFHLFIYSNGILVSRVYSQNGTVRNLYSWKWSWLFFYGHWNNFDWGFPWFQPVSVITRYIFGLQPKIKSRIMHPAQLCNLNIFTGVTLAGSSNKISSDMYWSLAMVLLGLSSTSNRPFCAIFAAFVAWNEQSCNVVDFCIVSPPYK